MGPFSVSTLPSTHTLDSQSQRISVYGIMDVQTYSPVASEPSVSPSRLAAVTLPPPASPTRPEPGCPAADLLGRLNTGQSESDGAAEVQENGGGGGEVPEDDDESFLYPSSASDGMDDDDNGQRTPRSESPTSPLSSG